MTKVMRLLVIGFLLMSISGCGLWKWRDKRDEVTAVPQATIEEVSEEVESFTVESTAATFTIITPDVARAGEKFTAKIVAKDEFGVVLTNYDTIGSDVEITTTGSGTISPTKVAASAFKDGIATVDFVYDKTESFTIVARAKVPKRKEYVKLEVRKDEIRKAEEKARPKAKEYTIDQEDELDISVWEWNDLKARVIVRPDGKISFPLVGDLQAEGLTLTELDAVLTERLKEYIREPEVSVMLRKYGGNKVIVLGEVEDPGVYRTTGKNSIMEVIALAQGFTDDAVISSVVLVRGNLSQPQAQRVNLARVIKKGDLSENVAVQPEDIVYVPKKFIANINYFLDQLTPALEKADLYHSWEGW